MSSQENIKTVRRAIEAFNMGDTSSVHEFISPDYVNKESQKAKDSYRSQLRGPEEFIDSIKNLRSAFPDLHYEEQEIISQDDKVVFIGIVTGTKTGSFFFIPPTGNKISYETVHVHTIGKNGKIIEHRAIRDDLKFMLQLGLVKASSIEYENPQNVEGNKLSIILCKNLSPILPLA
ncbi:MAG TPA: ester cyclase [Nitrososphaeraceae archaeon]|nr:ester cyclase [Nitrososphaeraceae archaeon]